MLTIPHPVWNQIIRHAEQGYPNETCGLLVGSKNEKTASHYYPCRNIYDEMHARHPETYPRTARTAYLMDPAQQQKIFDGATAQELEIKGIMHSHTDHEAYFSEEDSLVAAPWGEPMIPGVSYIVVSVSKGKFQEMKEYCWDESKKLFVQN
ncbi:MAG: M67 family metallopeptidase [Deltaproteobacteria bacterium]|nr:M67 family metallopeptidase [Deltaproteobacteria bacterium]